MKSKVQVISAILALVACMNVSAQIAGDSIRIGVMTDMGGMFSPWSGKGSVIAAEMAVDDFKKSHPNRPYKIEVVQADFQQKADLAVAITRKWMDEGVNAIVDIPSSGAALAVRSALKGGPMALLLTGAQHDDITTKECLPNMVHWVFDSTTLIVPPLLALMKSAGKTFFFITVDGAGGKALEDAMRKFITENGGSILGGVRTPANTNDFSSYLLQAQASKASVIVLAESGTDLVAALKQADEFAIAKSGQKIHAPSFKIQDVYGIGLPLAKGLRYTDGFYHDADEGKRNFAKRFAERLPGQAPSSDHAGVYSVVTHYLKAADEAKSNNGPVVVAKMRQLPVSDPLLGPGKLRIDGRMVHDMYIFEVKAPAESKAPWDLLKIVQTLPGEQVFRPLSKECPLVK